MMYTLGFVAGLISCFTAALFIVSILIRRNDIADVAWGVGIMIVGWGSVWYAGFSPVVSAMLVLLTLWGVRLALRIGIRNSKKDEDYRYKAWRESWGKWFYLRSYFQVFLLQGLLMIVVGYSVIHASVYGSHGEVGMVQYLGLGVWIIGFFFEVVGDYQLDRFIKNPANKGQLLTSGLWRYSRHPNYFGEVTMWWGLWLMVASLPLGFIALISPLTITFLILKVSGVPLLEAKYAGNLAFEEYKKRTSVFFPLPPRS